MIGPEPKIGWVLRYSYLWSDEGADDVKERPAVVVLAVQRAEGRILVLCRSSDASRSGRSCPRD